MLTANQESFSHRVVGGANQSTAYRDNYSTRNMLPSTVHEAASRLAANPKVAARIQELRDAVTANAIMWSVEEPRIFEPPSYQYSPVIGPVGAKLGHKC